MSEAPDPLEQVERAASELVPQLTEKLSRLGLGEIEVRQGDLRVRVAKALTGFQAQAAPRAGASQHATAAQHAGSSTERIGVTASGPSGHRGDLAGGRLLRVCRRVGPGLPVDKGDELGHVEMLGVRHDVRAPRRGTVRNLVTEAGEAVEYGQLLIELEAAE